MSETKIKHVYFIYDPRNKLIKIGSSINPVKRYEFFVTRLNKYKLLYVFWGGGKRKEKEFHIKFKKYLYEPEHYREWFVFSKEIKTFVNILRKNKLVWIGNIPPKKTMYIGFKTDKKTYNKIKELGEKNGYSIQELTEYIIRRIARVKR